MYIKTLLIAFIVSFGLVTAKDAQLQVGVKYKPDECPLKTRKGDKLSMQYVLFQLRADPSPSRGDGSVSS